MTISLRDVVNEILDEGKYIGPDAVADEAFKRLTRGDYASALRQSLREFARLAISLRRRRGGPQPKPQKSGRSWRHRDAVSALLNTQYEIGDGRYKVFGDMTRDDLLYAAKVRREQAAQNAAKADWLERFANELSPGQKVRQLPRTRLLELRDEEEAA
jgi:hypothetical protein